MDLAERLDAAGIRLGSVLTAWETGSALCFNDQYSVAAARAGVQQCLSAPVSQMAADAYARFGKGRHPAPLNMADCFAYACAMGHRARLLFAGNAVRTDIEIC